jgi:tetraacyldisaccharide 4'-kinase
VSAAEYWKAVTRGQKRGVAAAVVRLGLSPLSGLWWLSLHANLGVYRYGLVRQVRLDRPVVVVGNLTLGGTGKTTATAFLARRLAAVGRRAGIILRGYRRDRGHPPLLVSNGGETLASVEEAGDEAVLLASLLPGHPVAVGVRRERVARLLIDATDPGALILDDGLQYFRLARDADIVLLDASHRIEEDRLFPAGTLREPARHLRRAAQVWITHAELVPAERIAELRTWVERTAPGTPVAVTEHRPAELRSLTGAPLPPPGSRVVGVSGLGNPESFAHSLRRLGYDARPMVFPDHHRYERGDWERIRQAAAHFRAEHVITTDKDAVKLPAVPSDLASVHSLGCELMVRDGEAVVEDLTGKIASWPGP